MVNISDLSYFVLSSLADVDLNFTFIHMCVEYGKQKVYAIITMLQITKLIVLPHLLMYHTQFTHTVHTSPTLEYLQT
jgi:hypothetical protein